MKRTFVVAAVVLASCAAPPAPVPLTPAAEIPGAAVVRRPIEPTPTPPPTAAAIAKPAAPKAAAPVVVPADRQYVCVTHVNGERQQTAIEFAPKVAELCRKHPEMGPCQYERNLCRRSGGRVYTDGGREITLVTEAEYDRKVMRVRFRAN
jgi:hypothetical protein